MIVKRNPFSRAKELVHMSDSPQAGVVVASDELAERLAAVDAVHALCDALDSRNPEAVGALFTESGAFAPFGPALVGPQAIAAGMTHLADAPDQRHVITNVRTTRSGEGVVVNAVFSVYHFNGGAIAPSVVVATSTTCERHGDTMMITHHGGRPLTPMPGPPPGR
jgi:hypothetical protein